MSLFHDLAFDVHESQAYRMYAVETLYAGYRVSPQWAVGVELNEHIAFVTEAMRPIARELGLRTAADVPA